MMSRLPKYTKNGLIHNNIKDPYYKPCIENNHNDDEFLIII